MVFFLLAFGITAVDQAVKWVVMTQMTLGQSIPLIGPIFYLTYVRNPGAAFSLFPYKTAILVIIAVAAMVGILIFSRRIPKGRLLLKFSLALYLGGALGNLIDRLRFGAVIDFFDFRVWPVFNIADMAIVFGVAMLILDFVRTERAANSPEPAGGKEPAGS